MSNNRLIGVSTLRYYVIWNIICVYLIERLNNNRKSCVSAGAELDADGGEEDDEHSGGGQPRRAPLAHAPGQGVRPLRSAGDLPEGLPDGVRGGGDGGLVEAGLLLQDPGQAGGVPQGRQDLGEGALAARHRARQLPDQVRVKVQFLGGERVEGPGDMTHPEDGGEHLLGVGLLPLGGQAQGGEDVLLVLVEEAAALLEEAAQAGAGGLGLGLLGPAGHLPGGGEVRGWWVLASYKEDRQEVNLGILIKITQKADLDIP